VTLAEAFCISALQSALRGPGQPEIVNSDQGVQLTSQGFTAVLKAAGVRISMDGKGRAMANIMVERRWRSVKYEEIYLKDYRQLTDLIAALKVYFQFYNHERPHQSLRGRPRSRSIGARSGRQPEGHGSGLRGITRECRERPCGQVGDKPLGGVAPNLSTLIHLLSPLRRATPLSE